MPGQNAELLNVLEEAEFWAKDEAERNELLDSLLAVNSGEESSFREAVSKHAKAWGIFEKTTEDWIKTKSSYFGAAKTADDYYDSEDFLDPEGDPTFLELQQAAAARRVKFNLNQITDEQVLLNILQYNEAECRAYLAEKVDTRLESAFSWEENAVVEPSELNINHSSDVLDDTAIDEIKQVAAACWVLQQIEKADHQQLERLNLKNNIDFKKVLEELGFPKGSMAHVDVGRVWGTIDKTVQARLAEFRPVAAMTAYTDYVAKLNADELLASAELLKLEGNAFQDQLPKLEQSGEHLTPDDVVKLRENLGARYLDVAVAQLADVKPLLQAQNLKAFQLILKHEFPNHTYIDTAVTQEKMESLKGIMAPKAIPALSEAIKEIKVVNLKEEELKKLKNLGGAKTLEAFKIALAAFVKPELQAAIPYLSSENMVQLQQVARRKRFEVQVTFYASSSRQSIMRPQLLGLFDKLDSSTQRALLERSSDSKGTPVLPHILKAKDASVLKHYLPDASDTQLNEVLKENQDAQCLKGIFNPAISKILGDLYPEISLNDEQVKEINTYLIGKQGQVFTNDGDYTRLIAEIHKIVKPANSQSFYKAFGLNDDGTAITQANVHQLIDNQHQYNQTFLKVYAYPDVYHVNQKLLSLFLTVEKTAKIAKITNASSVKTVIADTFQFSSKPENFIDTVAPIKKDESKGAGADPTKDTIALNVRLKEELTQSVYHDIKNDIRHNAFMNFTSDVIQPIFKQVQLELKGLKKKHNLTDEYYEKMKFIPAIQDHHIHNPLFQSKSVPMREKYVEIAKECDVLIDQLRRDRTVLQGYLESTQMSEENSASGYVKLKKKVDAFRVELEEEIKKIDEQLEFYSEVQEKISGKDGILDKIDHVSSTKFTYQPTGVTTYLIDRAKLASEEGKKIKVDPDTADPDHTTVDPSGNAPVSRFVLEDKPKDSEVRCFDTVYKTPPSGSTPSVAIEGRFVYDTADKDVVGIQTGKGNKISKADPGKFAIHKFPNDDKVGEEVLAEARVRFAMTMATQILASMDKPPTKDRPIRIRGIDPNEAKYLWTALAILGEKTPNMRFSTDALAVHGSTFKPSEQKGFFGYTGDSLYNKEFKKHLGTNSIKELVSDAKKHSSERFDKSAVNKNEQKAETITNFFKKELSATKEETEKRQKKEGITPDPKMDAGGPSFS